MADEIKSTQDKTEWMALAAHQLRTSLSAEKWMVEMFLGGDFGELSVEQKTFLNRLKESNNRNMAVVNELLLLAKTEGLSSTPTVERVDVTPLVESVIFDFHGQSHIKGIEVLFLKPESVSIFAKTDKEKLRIVIQNLIENAIKYSKKDDRVFVSIEIKNDLVLISVKDTGIGIPKEDQAHIFEKNFRAPNAQKETEIGSGLGLYMSKRIAENLGGTLTFSSDESGSTFVVSTPLWKE